MGLSRRKVSAQCFALKMKNIISRGFVGLLKVFDEIIVIDNNSSDKTLSIVADVQLDTPKAQEN